MQSQRLRTNARERRGEEWRASACLLRRRIPARSCAPSRQGPDNEPMTARCPTHAAAGGPSFSQRYRRAARSCSDRLPQRARRAAHRVLAVGVARLRDEVRVPGDRRSQLDRRMPVSGGALLVRLADACLMEVLAGKNWRNLGVVSFICLIGVVNPAFHPEGACHGRGGLFAAGDHSSGPCAGFPHRARIIPSLLGNWLVRVDPALGKGARAPARPSGRKGGQVAQAAPCLGNG